MIGSFRSKALRRFWEEGDRRGLRPDMVKRVAYLLDALDTASVLKEADVLGARVHILRGKPTRYALVVNKNWRVTFGWDVDGAQDVDLEDYH
jgi:proteic killer suppression protein